MYTISKYVEAPNDTVNNQYAILVSMDLGIWYMYLFHKVSSADQSHAKS